MSFWGGSSGSTAPPHDSPDLAFLMSVVTSVGGVSAWQMRGSSAGLVAGLGVGSLFLAGGLKIADSRLFNRETPTGAAASAVMSHEMGHQLCLIGSLMFAGAMFFRAGSNPYSGPGGAMLASLGAISGAYHMDKMVEWRRWEEARVAEAERLLRQHHALRERSGGAGD